MTKLLTLIAFVLVAACGTDPMYDPTGEWTMSLTWANDGDCGLQSPWAETLVIDELANGNYLVRDASNSNATATGTVKYDHDSATLDVDSTDPDLFRDGGSTTGTLFMNVSADQDRLITGACSIHVTGFFVCAQSCTARGALVQ